MSEQQRRWAQYSIKTVLIIMLMTASYFAGRFPAQQRARHAERQLRIQAEQAVISEQAARQRAEEAMNQAQLAMQQLSKAKERSIAE